MSLERLFKKIDTANSLYLIGHLDTPNHVIIGLEEIIGTAWEDHPPKFWNSINGPVPITWMRGTGVQFYSVVPGPSEADNNAFREAVEDLKRFVESK